MPAIPDFPRFRARAPWWGGDLQTLRNTLVRYAPSLEGWPGEPLRVALSDGDQLFATRHRPERAEARPTVVLIHGLTGSEDSTYIRASAAYFLERGWPVIRLNLRGAGPSGPYCRSAYHAGRSEDLRAFLAGLAQQDPQIRRHGALPLGYSLGANMLLKFLAERDFPVPLPGAVAVSAPIDLEAASRAIARPRNALYQRYLLACLRAEFRRWPLDLSVEERREVLSARTLLAFDEVWTARRNGFAGALDYYRRSSAAPLLPKIQVPTLLLHAADDPWIPAAPHLQAAENASPLQVLVAPSGGHVGFHAADDPRPWHDRCAERFFRQLAAGDGVAAAS